MFYLDLVKMLQELTEYSTKQSSKCVPRIAFSQIKVLLLQIFSKLLFHQALVEHMASVDKGN